MDLEHVTEHESKIIEQAEANGCAICTLLVGIIGRLNAELSKAEDDVDAEAETIEGLLENGR